jgi:hypothetical protein
MSEHNDSAGPCSGDAKACATYLNGPLQGGITSHDETTACAGAEATQTKRDELDLAQFRISQDVADFAGGRKLVTTIPIRKPAKEWWSRSSPDQRYWFRALVIELKESGEFYLPEPNVRTFLQECGEKTLVQKLLILSQNKQGDCFLWPIRVPAADQTLDAWSRSSLDAAARAKRKWIRMYSNKSLGAYEILEHGNDCTEAKWPDLTMGEVMKIAFKGKLIKSIDHPVVCELLGRTPEKRDVVKDIMQECFRNDLQEQDKEAQ